MIEASSVDPALNVVEEICCPSLARRMSALLNREDDFQLGDSLPRGWHVMMFNPPTLQSELRHDGAANLGVEMPDLGLPKLMMGGRTIKFAGDIPLGERVVRRSALGPVTMKEGRSGPFAVLDVEHCLSVVGGPQNVVVETSSYIMRAEEASRAGATDRQPAMASKPTAVTPKNGVLQTFLPDESLLFRYSAITDNPHRIHYDYPYATKVEGYPALVVNGTLPQMFLLEMFRRYTGREPSHYQGRNIAAIYCGTTITLSLEPTADKFILLAQSEDGRVAVEASAC